VQATILTLPGDGVGPEVMAEARKVLQSVGQRFGHIFSFEERNIGGVAIDAFGTALREEDIDVAHNADAILLGAVGGPKWDNPNAAVRPEQGLLRMRKALRLFANLRPVRLNEKLIDASPLRPERIRGTDLIVVRELTGGLYFGKPSRQWRERRGRVAVDTLIYREHEIERVVRLAFDLARGRSRKVTSVDMTMNLIQEPSRFDVIVTENMFGDIITDEASVLGGSIGLLPSACIGASDETGSRRGLYEPIHGSAPDIAGQGIANPAGMILSAAMMLRQSFDLEPEAMAIEQAVNAAVGAGMLTRDLGGDTTTTQFGTSVVDRLGG
jgi:3-isopropylmalate dehydrogenase